MLFVCFVLFVFCLFVVLFCCGFVFVFVCGFFFFFFFFLLGGGGMFFGVQWLILTILSSTQNVKYRFESGTVYRWFKMRNLSRKRSTADCV